MPTYTRTAIEKAATAVETRPGEFTAVQIKKYLDDLAADERKPLSETPDQAFSRVVTKTDLGRRLFKALRSKVASGEPDHDPADEEPPRDEQPGPPMTTHLQLLHEMAAEHAEKDPKLSPLLAKNPARAKARALLQVIRSPEGAALWRRHMAEVNTGAHR